MLMKYKKSISYIHKVFDTGDISKKNITSTKTVNFHLQIKRNEIFNNANAYVFIFSSSGDKMVSSI